MKYLFLALVSLPAMAAMTPNEVACTEAARVNFNFETSCGDEFYKPSEISAEDFVFEAPDASGDCGITVWVAKKDFTARSRVTCN